ncbi:hypothetical protein PIB30_017933 [Stylosanthes scabra]|uniref:Uncharacterized protein n=1 Tax=Stylosanthes scabra TaxID=79078 RepID=A0ABU6R818_9FABA|nr:hypothetical protein [Stylosanthes scabra]
MLVKRTPVDTEANQNLFKRAFFIFIQKVFLLATFFPNVTLKALPTLFGLETTRERNWALHVHDFLLDKVKQAKLNKTKAVHGCCYVMMIIYFNKTHFGKNSREPEAQPPWIAYWTGENLKKRLHREQNHSTGLVQTRLLRAAKEKLLKRNMKLKMGVNLNRKEPTSSKFESEYEFEEESNSGGSSPDLDSENTMSKELVERRALSKPTPAQQEKRSKKKHKSSASGVVRSEDCPLIQSIRRPALIMQAEQPLQPRPQTHPQPQRERAAKKARKPTHDDRVGRASDHSEDGNQPPPPKMMIPKSEEANLSTEEAQPQPSQTVVEVV